jgi:hypothetical protein
MKTNLIKLACGLALLGFSISAFAQSSNSNLLVNPGAETGNMNGWTITASGGNGWAVGFDSLVHSGSYSFSTSHGWDTRYQTVDLLAAGFTTAELDTAPDITFSEWMASRPDDGGQYYLNFELLGADDNPADPIASYSFGSQSSPIVLSAGSGWFQESYTFSDYGTGVRYLYFEDGGSDVNGWGGNYGTHFDDASVLVAQPVPEPSTLALAGLSGLSLLLFCRRECPAFNRPKPTGGITCAICWPKH